MGVYTYTLTEVMSKVPQGVLFKPLPYIDYRHIVDLITAHYIDREIAYDSIDKFATELNIRLTLDCDPYNKMLRAQLAEIDPFITDYMVNEGSGTRESNTSKSGRTGSRTQTASDGKTTQDTDFNEDYAHATNTGHEQENATVGTKGTLSSSTDNRSTDTSVDRTKNTNTTENYDSEEITDNGTVTTISKTTGVKSTDTQTGREWTENGNSKSHILDVHSDTPQAMLFNEPDHYTGTGRSDNHGYVTTDSEGNESYTEYPETTVSSIDSEGWTINEGDTPWYNYASDANNKTGHDTYAKSGTETYTKGGTSDTSESSTENSQQDKTVDMEYEKTIQTDETENTNTTTLDSNAHNANEHSKEDTHTSESYEGEEKTKYNKTNLTNIIGTSRNTGSQLNNTETAERENTGSKSTSTYVRKGRNNFSPSDLMRQYRSLLDFSADKWLLADLEPLFLQLY